MGKKKLVEHDLFGEEIRETCPVIKKGRGKLSAAQSEFNRLNKKITALRDNIRELPERERVIKTFFSEQAASLFDEEREVLFHLLERLDEIYEGAIKLTQKEKSIFPELVLKEMEHIDDFDWPEEQWSRVSELKDKYLELASGMTREEREQESVNIAMELCRMMGVKPNAKMKKAKTEEEFEAALLEHLNREQEKRMQKEIQKEEKRKQKAASAPEGKNMSKRELMQKMQEEQTLRSIREIYIELVKELHPDKETDEQKRLLKEERMKRLTEAYQAKDLALLLRMQIEWLDESAVTPDTQDDDVLKRYNKLLRSQLGQLVKEYDLMCHSPFPGVLGAYGSFRKFRLDELDRELSNLLKIHVRELKKTKEYANSFSAASAVRAILKEFKQTMIDAEEDGFMNFFDSLMKF